MTEFAEKNLRKNKEMVFGNGVKNIQAAAYNGKRTVYQLLYENFTKMTPHKEPRCM